MVQHVPPFQKSHLSVTSSNLMEPSECPASLLVLRWRWVSSGPHQACGRRREVEAWSSLTRSTQGCSAEEMKETKVWHLGEPASRLTSHFILHLSLSRWAQTDLSGTEMWCLQTEMWCKSIICCEVGLAFIQRWSSLYLMKWDSKGLVSDQPLSFGINTDPCWQIPQLLWVSLRSYNTSRVSESEWGL